MLVYMLEYELLAIYVYMLLTNPCVVIYSQIPINVSKFSTSLTSTCATFFFQIPTSSVPLFTLDKSDFAVPCCALLCLAGCTCVCVCV